MIAPYELKNKTFTRTVRGYNPVEVDEYFDFLIDKYTEAYKAVSELEKKYTEVQTRYSELSNEEESIRSAILKAQKLGEVIVANAKKEADDRKASLRGECDRIVESAKARVEEEKENLARLHQAALDFQKKLYDDYVKHITMIRDMDLDSEFDPNKILDKDEDFEVAEARAVNGPGPDILTGEDDAPEDVAEK